MKMGKTRQICASYCLSEFAAVVGIIIVLVIQCAEGQAVCPTDMSATAPIGQSYAEVQWREPTLMSDGFILTFQSHRPGPIPIGEHTVFYVYSSLGNVNEMARCSFRVEVLAADTEPPVISNCPSDIERKLECGVGNIVLTWTQPFATDNSGGRVTVDRNHAPGDEIYVGQSKSFFVYYTFTDPSGNKAYCNFEVRLNTDDTTPPVVTYCPQPRSVTFPLEVKVAALGWEIPSVEEKSSHLFWSINPDVPEVFSVGTATVSYIFVDGSDLTATCDVSLTVTQGDVTPPEVEYCPSCITVGVRPGSTMEFVSWDEPIVSDNSGTLFQRSSHSPGLHPVGNPFTVEYRFTDATGNEAYCSFIVQFVTDNEAPSVYGCPKKEITWLVETGATSARVHWSEPFALDETTVTLVFQTHFPFDEFSIGNTTVEYTFEDSVGNIASCEFIVRVSVTNEGQNEVEQISRILITAIVCITLLIISSLVIIGITMYCIKTTRSSQRPSPGRNMVIGHPSVSGNDNGGYMSPLRATRPYTGATDPHYHEYIEMNKASDSNYMQPDGGASLSLK